MHIISNGMKLLPISIVEINCLLWKFLNKKITALSITNSYINKTLLHILGDVEDGESCEIYKLSSYSDDIWERIFWCKKKKELF